MKNTPDVSIIVPVYNVEKYLRECVDSLIRQTLKNIEIILVDDGSSDSSGAICDEYAQKDLRVKVIHKKNEGPFNARKMGAKAAQANFIGFVDSDDWVTDDAFEKLYKGISRADFSFATATFYVYSNRIEVSGEIFKNDGYTVLDKTQAPGYRRGSCNSLFLKDKFLETISDMPAFFHHEDWVISAKYFSLIKTIYIVPEPLYYYRMRKSSLSHTNCSSKLDSIDLWNFFIENKIGYKDEEDLKNFRSLLWDDCLYGIVFSKNPEEKRKEAERVFGSFDLKGKGARRKIKYWLFRKKQYMLLRIFFRLYEFKKKHEKSFFE